MFDGAEGFETIVARSAFWLRLGWVAKAVLAGVGSLLLLLAVVAAVVEHVAPLPTGAQGAPIPWQAPLVAAVGAALLLRVTARAVGALAAGTREIVGVITHAKELTHAGQRTRYRLWHVVVDGREYTFAPSELRGSRTARLQPGQRAVVRLVGGRELVRLAVDHAAPRPTRAALAPPIGEPAPLSERDISHVTAWATRRAAVLFAFVVGLVALVASRGGPVDGLHALLAVVGGGLVWGFAGAARLLLVARALAPGAPTRYLSGALRQDAGILRDTYLGMERLGDAGVPSAPRLATTARARVVVLRVPDRDKAETLVAVEWLEETN